MRNFVAKYARTVNRAKRFKVKTQYQRQPKHKGEKNGY